ncbi:MAG: hypothetical protein ACYTAN_09180 [Planctomycetota bacterium]|jgi:hypothetical protein
MTLGDMSSKPRLLSSVFLVGLVLLMPPAGAKDAPFEPAVPAEQRLWLTILPASPIRSIGLFELTYFGPAIEDLDPDSTETNLEIRLPDARTVVARLPRIIPPHRRPDASWRFDPEGVVTLSDVQQELASGVGEGDYLIAVNVNGQRASNVAALKVHAGFNPLEDPVLQLVPLSLGPGQELPHVGFVVTGPEPADPDLWEFNMKYPVVIVDGVERRVERSYMTGSGHPLRPGERFRKIITDLDGAQPPIERGRQHEVRVRLTRETPIEETESDLGYLSDPVTIPAGGDLERLWDETRSSEQPPSGTDWPHEPAWSEPDEGIQVRLRSEPHSWSDRMPVLFLDVRNSGERTDLSMTDGQDAAELIVDGELYRLRHGRGSGGSSVLQLSLGREITGIRVSTEGPWYAADGRPLRLPPGKHDIEALVQVWQSSTNRPSMPLTNRVEITVAPATNAPPQMQSLEPEVEGPTAGVTVTLEPEKAVWMPGETPSFIAEATNNGARSWLLSGGDIPFAVELDGRVYERVGWLGGPAWEFGPGDVRSGIQIALRTARKTDELSDFLDRYWSGPAGGLSITPGRHRLRVGLILGRHLEGPDRQVKWSDYVEFEVLTPQAAARAEGERPATWGDSVEGVKARLIATRQEWLPGETPSFEVDLRNDGADELRFARPVNFHYWAVYVDGSRYYVKKHVSFTALNLLPGDQFTAMPLNLGDTWLRRGTDEHLLLEPGRHSVVVVLCIGVPNANRALEVVTNICEIEVTAADGEASEAPPPPFPKVSPGTFYRSPREPGRPPDVVK